MNNVGTLYVDIRADMANITTSLRGLNGLSANIGRDMGVNISGGFNNALQTLFNGITAFKVEFTSILPIFKTAFSGLSTGLVGLTTQFARLSRAANFNPRQIAEFFRTFSGPISPNFIASLNENQRRVLDMVTEVGSRALYLQQGFQNLRSVISTLGLAITTAFAVAGVAALTKLISLTKDLIVEGIKYNAELEQTRIAFTVLTGSASTAASIMKDLQDYADFSTFTTPQLNQGAQLLMNYGIAAEDVMHVVKMLGDTSMGNLQKFQSQTLAFGQIFARGRVTGDNLRQLTEAGFNPLQTMAQMRAQQKGGQAGDYLPGLQQEVEDGLVSVKDLVAAFEAATAAGGRFYNMQLLQSQSGIGMWSTIIDKFQRFRGEATKSLFEGLKPLLESVMGLMNSLLQNVESLADAFETYLLPVLQSAFSQLLNLTGLGNGIDDLTNKSAQWVQVLAFGIQVIIFTINILAIFFGGFMAGISVILASAYTFYKGFQVGWNIAVNGFLTGLATLANIFGQVFLGLGALIINAILEPLGNLEDAIRAVFNGLISGYNAVAGALGKDTIKFEFDSTGWINSARGAMNTTMAGWSQDLANWNGEIAKNAGEDIMNNLEQKSNEWMTGMEKINAGFLISADMVNGAFDNLMGDTTKVDNFLAKMKQNKQEYKKDDQKGIKTLDSTKQNDAAKKAADAIKKMGDEIRKARDEIMRFGDMFEKVTAEKFSPSKLLSRTRKFAKALAEFSLNINTLAGLGVGPDILASLREMGPKGWNIAKGLVRSQGTGQLQNILTNMASANSIAIGEGIMKMQHEHYGTIQLSGVDRNGAYQVGLDVAKSIRNADYNYIK